MKLAHAPARRLLWPDIVRIVAMVGVVVVHSIKLPTYTLPITAPFSLASLIIFVIAKTCVPLFLMLSGSLLLDKVESDRVFFLKRVRRVFIPWLTWTLVFLVTKYASDLTSIERGIALFRQIFTAEFTFLPVLFCLYLLMPFLRVLIQNLKYPKQVALVGWWFLTISLLPYLRNTLAFPVIVDNGLVRQTVNYSGYLVLGYLIKIMTTKYLALRAYWEWIMMFGWFSVGATVYLVLTTSTQPPIYLSYIAPLVLLSSAVSFYLLILLGKLLQTWVESKKTLSVWIEKISLISFGVFFSHPLIILLLETYVFNNSRPITVEHNLAMSGLAIIGSFGLIWLLSKIKFLGKLIC